MKKALLSVLAASLVSLSAVSPGTAGIEPSPWHIDIIFIQSRIFQIGQTLDLPDDVRDSLVQIDLRLASFDQDPQQNPWITPELVTQGLRVIGHVSEILINPQPEPPGLSPDLYGPSISVMYQVAGVMERTLLNAFDGTIPGLNALEQLSGHLVVAVVDHRPHRAAAQVNAMWRIAGQYAGY